MVDDVIVGKTRNRRLYASYYTESAHILDYMVHKLQASNGDSILEPCAGGGAFIADLLDKNLQTKFKLTAYDLNPRAIELLNEGIQDDRLEVILGDTLTDPALDKLESNGGSFSKIIGNPPYGAWQDLDKRHLLKLKYGGYVKETYTLFLQRCINLLAEDGRLVFIIPDTYLGLNMHKGIRKFILENTYVEEIALFPSKFFPGVNFGYSNLSIITLRKSKNKNSKIKILSFNKSVRCFDELTSENYTDDITVSYRDQNKILNTDDYPFHLNSDDDMSALLESKNITLGEIADCVTGFYSGDNQKYLYTKEYSTPSLKKYKLAETHRIYHISEDADRDELVQGLDGDFIIPLHKGGKNSFYQPTEWYVSWSKEDVRKYIEDPKPRFQNSKYYFTEGLAVPMVRSKKLKATLLEKRLFDQSVVGIFPHKTSHLNYLLAFLNSDIATKIIASINHTANNSAGYLKKIPIKITDESISKIDSIFESYKHDFSSEQFRNEINTVFSSLYAA